MLSAMGNSARGKTEGKSKEMRHVAREACRKRVVAHRPLVSGFARSYDRPAPAGLVRPPQSLPGHDLQHLDGALARGPHEPFSQVFRATGPPIPRDHGDHRVGWLASLRELARQVQDRVVGRLIGSLVLVRQAEHVQGISGRRVVDDAVEPLPQSPPRSTTDSSRKRSRPHGSTTTESMPRSRAASCANRSAPQAADATSLPAPRSLTGRGSDCPPIAR
jgi:hypothetical protein